MYSTLGIKTDYTLLNSLIKISDLVSFGVENNIKSLGILDDNLFGSIEFYDECLKNNIKPIIGLDILFEERHFYLYAKNYNGYKSLLKINTLVQEDNINYDNLIKYNEDVILVIPFNSKEYFNKFNDSFSDIYISYENDYEKKNALVISKNIVKINICNSLEELDEYFKILDNIRNDNKVIKCLKIQDINNEDFEINKKFVQNINIEIVKNKRHIPVYETSINNSYKFLCALCHKGLSKRFNNNIKEEYINRLNYELDVINKMGFVDYFLIVYDYVKYAKQNNIYVGPGRGSAAGSLVSYSIGITNIDPIKYNLLFERFLNPERITMPDIDVDFEDSKRDQVIEYVKEKYGKEKVASIMTYATLGSRQVLRDVAKYYDLDKNIDILTKVINANTKISLKDNLKNEKVKNILNLYSELKKVYKMALKLEGIKRQISTTAAGVAICDVNLDDIIPVYVNNNSLLAGLTLNYLEELGILKMDFLGITNLSVMHNIIDSIPNNFNINSINLNDEKVYELFSSGDTSGIFQFESEGMKNFLKKLKPKTFSDLTCALALYRPGPMEYINEFIARKNGKAKIDYIDDSLKDILNETYGIIIYQEQIMLILRRMANYTFAEADNIRRAMSKKKEDIIISEKNHFISSSIKNGYSEEVAIKTYEKILKFAGYGFNKAHSVSYALIGYQQAFLKVHYLTYYLCNLLNMVIGNENKTNEYLQLAKQQNIFLLKPSINYSQSNYVMENDKLRLPLSIIKNVGLSVENEIILKRGNNIFKDYFDFVARCYSKNINKKVIEYLIKSGALDDFNYNHKTLIDNLESAIRYSELLSNLDESFVEKPILEIDEEFDKSELIKQEYDAYGFYLTNHPASRYQGKEIVKLCEVDKFFNKFIKCIVIINSIRVIKTKVGGNMAFILASDETSKLNFLLFNNEVNLIKNIKENDLVEINGRVTKRYNEYQVNINKINKV